jgi:hypothetical protein
LPYHPQYISARTALVVQLASDASLPTENYAPASNTEWALPANDTLLRARLTSQVSSKSKQGTQVEAVVSEPLYSADHKLEVPEGTRLIGSVQMSQAAQSWKRGGEVRIEFHTLRPPAGSPDEQKIYHVQAVLTAIDTPRIRNIAVDPEGSTRATEPFTRFLVPSLKLLVDTQFIDSDQQNGQSAATRTAWRTLAGASGYGVLGGAASQVSRNVAAGLGFYGLGWSIFTHIVARGREVVLPPDTPVQVRLTGVPFTRAAI